MVGIDNVAITSEIGPDQCPIRSARKKEALEKIRFTPINGQ